MTDCISNQAEVLGITFSDKNIAKVLWDIHCDELSMQEEQKTEIVLESSEDGLEESTSERIAGILSFLQEESDDIGTERNMADLEWVDRRLAILVRLKGDIELSLRVTSSLRIQSESKE